ncbi:MAG: DNA-binding protein [Candidatus Micrarchaeota archaeon]
MDEQAAVHKNARANEQAQMVKDALRQILQPDAYERLMIVASKNTPASRELYSKAAQWLITMAQKGMAARVNEEQLKAILLRLSPIRQTKIEFRRKGE